MAIQTGVFDVDGVVSANAGAGLAQFTAATLDSAGNELDFIYPSGSGVFAVGIVQSVGGPPTVGSTTPPVNTSGQSVTVRMLGITKAIAAAAVTIGQLVSVSGAVGQLGPAAAPGATNTFVVGIALTPATAQGDVFSVLLTPGLTTQVNA